MTKSLTTERPEGRGAEPLAAPVLPLESIKGLKQFGQSLRRNSRTAITHPHRCFLSASICTAGQLNIYRRPLLRVPDRIAHDVLDGAVQ